MRPLRLKGSQIVERAENKKKKECRMRIEFKREKRRGLISFEPISTWCARR
jgi:hypothetical protein